MSKLRNHSEGFILLVVMTMTIFIMMMGIVTLQLITSNLRTAKSERYLVNAQFAADAGLDEAVRQLNADQTWTGSGTEQTLYSSSEFRTTYLTTVTAGATTTQKFITVNAKTYAPASNTTPKYVRKYSLEMRGISSGDYSVVSGVGGLIMSNSSKIVGGNVYVNGKITMSNSAQIGLSTSPVNVKSAHQSCPSPATATYPTVCGPTENGQPITITNLARIYGEVQATNQTNGAGMSLPGLVAGNPPPVALPTHDRAAQVAAVVSTYTGNLTCNTGTLNWPADYRVTGNVTIANTCQVTVNGDSWVEGNFTLSNSARIIVSPSLGTTRPVLMVDNVVSLQQNTTLQSNSNGTGFRVITYRSSAACSPNCVTVTGDDLFNSSTIATINLENSSTAPQTEFFARWSQINIANGGNIGALVGQTVNMSNSGAVTFGVPVTGVGGIQAWVVKSYKRTF